MPAALVTGASRRAGIAAAIVTALECDGWSVATTGRERTVVHSVPEAQREVEVSDADGYVETAFLSAIGLSRRHLRPGNSHADRGGRSRLSPS